MRNGFKIGKSWLFFGCRHPDRDHLYRYTVCSAVFIFTNVCFGHFAIVFSQILFDYALSVCNVPCCQNSGAKNDR